MVGKKEQWANLNDMTFQTMFQEFQSNDNKKLTIELTKSIESMENTEVTFSETAIQDAMKSIQVFFTGKLLQFWNENEIAPADVKIEVEVNIEG